MILLLMLRRSYDMQSRKPIHWKQRSALLRTCMAQNKSLDDILTITEPIRKVPEEDREAVAAKINKELGIRVD